MTMRLLFAITVCSFCAVMWVALALARRIRLGQMLTARSAPRPSSTQSTQEFFEAGEFRTPRPLRLEQEILQQKPRRPLSEVTFVPERPTVVSAGSGPNIQRPGSPGPIPIRSAPAYASLFGQTVPIARIDSHTRPAVTEIVPPASDTSISNAAPVSPPVPFSLHRRPPQPARLSGLRRRVDLSHYNKDMGDLTDPYTHPLRGSGTQGPVPTNRTDR